MKHHPHCADRESCSCWILEVIEETEQHLTYSERRVEQARETLNRLKRYVEPPRPRDWQPRPSEPKEPEGDPDCYVCVTPGVLCSFHGVEPRDRPATRMQIQTAQELDSSLDVEELEQMSRRETAILLASYYDDEAGS